MVLSLEDGLLTYTDQNGKNLPYPSVGADLKHRFMVPGYNDFAHFRVFGTYMFMLTSSKTLLYPEFSDYMGTIEGSFKRDQA